MTPFRLCAAAVDHLFREGQLLLWGVASDGCSGGDAARARGPRVTWPKPRPRSTGWRTAPADEGLVIREIWLLRLRALLARAHGDDAAYRDYRDRYRDMARTLGFEGHMEWAEAMP